MRVRCISFQAGAGDRAGGDLGEQGGDVAAVDPVRLGRRRRKAQEVEQVERARRGGRDADEVRQGVAAVVAGRGGECAAPLVQLRVERGQVRRQREGCADARTRAATPAARTGGRRS